MHIDPIPPYITGGEVTGSVLSMLMSLTFLLANQHYITTRMKRMFFITSYHAVFTYMVLHSSITHVLMNHLPVMGIYTPIDDYYIHLFDVKYILVNSWILVGILYSFTTNKEGD